MVHNETLDYRRGHPGGGRWERGYRRGRRFRPGRFYVDPIIPGRPVITYPYYPAYPYQGYPYSPYPTYPYYPPYYPYY